MHALLKSMVPRTHSSPPLCLPPIVGWSAPRERWPYLQQPTFIFNIFPPCGWRLLRHVLQHCRQSSKLYRAQSFWENYYSNGQPLGQLGMTMLFRRFISTVDTKYGVKYLFFSMSNQAYKGSQNQWTSMTPICVIVSSKNGWPRSLKGPKGFEDQGKTSGWCYFLHWSTHGTDELMIHLMI